MNPSKLIGAIFMPFIQLSVLFPVVMFWIFISIGIQGGPLGLLVLILSLPPMFRYVMIVVEATARGDIPGAFDAEFFNWTGNLWSLFPLPMALGLIYAAVSAGQQFGEAGTYSVLALACLLVPGSLAVLAITHSPLQSLNPVAIWRVTSRAGSIFWFASVYLRIVGIISVKVEVLPNLAANFIQIALMYSFAAVTGTLIEPFGLIHDVSIPDSIEPDEDRIAGDLQESRSLELSHAYGFISRGNREGGFRHVMDWIAKEADVAGAWAWFFEAMMRWERKEHALFFAQHYIHDLLLHGQKIPALKVIIIEVPIDSRFAKVRGESSIDYNADRIDI